MAATDYTGAHSGAEVDDGVGVVKGGGTGLAVKTGTGGGVRRSLTAGSTKITITNGDGVAGNPSIDVNQINIDHDLLLNFVANEHIDWTADQGATNIDVNNVPLVVGGVSDGLMSQADKTKLDGVETGATADQTAGEIRTLGFFDVTNDGAGSGLDADLLDGNQATAFELTGAYRPGGTDVAVTDGGTGASDAITARTNLGAAADLVTINNQTGTTYTLVLSDQSKLLRLDNAAAITLTVPPNSSVAFPVGTVIALQQQGAGQVTVSPGSGVVINSNGSRLKLNGQFAGASLIKTVSPDTWWLSGNTAA